MAHFVWWEIPIVMKDVWRSVLIMFGVQSVIIAGLIQMLKLFADS